MRAHPFGRGPDGMVREHDIPDGMLSPAVVDGGHFDAENPFYRAFEARCGLAA